MPNDFLDFFKNRCNNLPSEPIHGAKEVVQLNYAVYLTSSFAFPLIFKLVEELLHKHVPLCS